MFCGNCGSKIEDGVKFCGNCGSKVTSKTEVLDEGTPQDASRAVQPIINIDALKQKVSKGKSWAESKLADTKPLVDSLADKLPLKKNEEATSTVDSEQIQQPPAPIPQPQPQQNGPEPQKNCPQQSGFTPQHLPLKSKDFSGRSMCIVALILGICALVLSWVPVLGIIIAGVGLVLGFIGKNKANEAGVSAGAAGLVLSIIGLILSVILTISILGSCNDSGNNNTRITSPVTSEGNNDSNTSTSADVIKTALTPISSENAQNYDYIEIGQMFTDAGFVNVSTTELFDIDPDFDDSIYKNVVSIDGTSDFGKEEAFPIESEISIICHRPYEKYTLSVNVEFVPNLLFSTYDVDLLIDNVQQETLEHGKDAYFEFRLRPGDYSITFAKCDESSISNTTEIKIESDTTVSYKIACFNDEVTIEDLTSQYLERQVISKNLTVHFIDVGQGDAILVQLPNGEIMLIDGGEISQRYTVRDYFKEQEISKIDYLVATHPHSDHIGGLSDIINRADIGAIYMPRVSHISEAFEELLERIERNGLEINTAKAGVNIIDIDGLTVDIVAPAHNNYDEINEHSAVIHIRYRDTAFLFMGDAGELSEDQIAADITADVLKVGNHGSNSSTSDTFLDKVNPDYAVISVGENNVYKYPSNYVLERLYNAEISVYRTDLQGTIVFTSDGNEITINTDSVPEPTPTPTPTPRTTIRRQPGDRQTPPPSPTVAPLTPSEEARLKRIEDMMDRLFK